jgi:hypothetical protein
LPDHHKPGPNTRYTIKDAVLGPFDIYDTLSPSFLEYNTGFSSCLTGSNRG